MTTCKCMDLFVPNTDGHNCLSAEEMYQDQKKSNNGNVDKEIIKDMNRRSTEVM